MIFVGIDVAKDKHDCFITNTDGELLFKSFTITNNLDGFNELYQKIESVMEDVSKVKVGLEATGHYSYNLLEYLLDKVFPTYVINPLHTNLYRKSLSLRQTKTDKVDAHTFASMLMSDVSLKSYSDTSYHNEELKSLTRYRFDKVKERAKLKTSISRLVCILFPELEKLVPTLHQNSVYELLYEFSINIIQFPLVCNELFFLGKIKFSNNIQCYIKIANGKPRHVDNFVLYLLHGNKRCTQHVGINH